MQVTWNVGYIEFSISRLTEPLTHRSTFFPIKVCGKSNLKKFFLFVSVVVTPPSQIFHQKINVGNRFVLSFSQRKKFSSGLGDADICRHVVVNNARHKWKNPQHSKQKGQDVVITVG